MKQAFDSVERKVLVGFFGALAVMAALALATYTRTSDFIAQARELNRIHTALGKLDQVFKHLAESEARQADFVRSGSKADLNACQDALFAIDRLVSEIRTLSRDQSGQMQRLDQLGALVATEINVVSGAVRRRQANSQPDRSASFDRSRARDTMADIGTLLTDFKAGEDQLVSEQSGDFERRTHAITRVLGAGILVNLLIFAFVYGLIHREMTLRQAAEAGLAAQTRMLKTVVHDMNEAVLVYDAQGRLNVSNPAAERIFGQVPAWLTPESLGGKGPLFLSESLQPLPYAEIPIIRAMAGRECDDVTVYLKRPDGRGFYLSVSTRAFHGTGGAVEGAMAVFHDITEQKNAELALHGAKDDMEERVNALKLQREELRNESIRDALTGLFNRRHLDEVFEKDLDLARRNGQSLGVVMTDIDFFKKFNDSFGHDAGDLVLKQVGAAIQRSLRAADLLFRFGGEEFILILPGASLIEAQRVAEKTRRSVESLRLTHLGRDLGRLSVSLGIAGFPQTAATTAELLHQADQALYQAKHGGRNRSVIWEAKAAAEGR
jgi:diguanylate cyclase (GGDEF)-like protein/PAS domain S-box-containing protein